MEELTMFERLLTLPLFQGMTMKELSDVLAHVRLDFVNYQPGDDIVLQDDPCRNLVCIINGEISSTLREKNGRFMLYEKLPKVTIIEPYNMFGMYQKYSRDYSFHTEGVTLTIERQVFLNHLTNNKIVKINLMNIICNRYQQTLKSLCDDSDKTVTSKIVKFINTYASVPKGEKVLNIKMTDMADYLQETRLNVSKALRGMEQKGFVQLSREEIRIPSLEELNRGIRS